MEHVSVPQSDGDLHGPASDFEEQMQGEPSGLSRAETTRVSALSAVHASRRRHDQSPVEPGGEEVKMKMKRKKRKVGASPARHRVGMHHPLLRTT